MTIGSVWNICFDPADEDRVWDAVSTLDPLRVQYTGPSLALVQVDFVRENDRAIFYMTFPEAVLDQHELHADLELRSSPEDVLRTLEMFHPETVATIFNWATIWLADAEMEQAYNEAVTARADQFVGPPPLITIF
jgi:hypothetical protein